MALLLAGGLALLACKKDKDSGKGKGAGIDVPTEAKKIEIEGTLHVQFGHITYINLQTGKQERHEVPRPYYKVDGTEVVPAPKEQTVPTDWDIAFHHWYPATNKGAAIMTDKTDLNEVNAVPGADAPWVEDEYITTFTGEVKGGREEALVHMLPTKEHFYQMYAKMYFNSELAKFDKTVSKDMPREHFLQDNVFILKSRGKVYALRIYAKRASDAWKHTVVAKELQ